MQGLCNTSMDAICPSDWHGCLLMYIQFRVCNLELVAIYDIGYQRIDCIFQNFCILLVGTN